MKRPAAAAAEELPSRKRRRELSEAGCSPYYMHNILKKRHAVSPDHMTALMERLRFA